MRTIFACQSPAELQSLEPRWLLAAHVSFDDDAKLLHVIGDESNDQIEVSLQFPVDGPSAVRGMLVTVRDHRREIYSQFFLEGQLTTVDVAGEHGDDVISLSNSDSPVDTFISGDEGNDTISAFVSGRATPTQIHAGEGDDLVNLSASRDMVAGFFVLGDGGNDTINGSGRDDVLYGDNESVSPLSIPGNDVIHAGAGDDSVFGGDGNDQLFGDDGNDSLNGGDGADFVNGGAGDDMAVIDGSDKFVNVEKVVT